MIEKNQKLVIEKTGRQDHLEHRRPPFADEKGRQVDVGVGGGGGSSEERTHGLS